MPAPTSASKCTRHSWKRSRIWTQRLRWLCENGSTVSLSNRRRSAALIACELALKHRLPSMFGGREHVEAGGLISYATDYDDLTRRAAAYIDKILKGAKPADLPIE